MSDKRKIRFNGEELGEFNLQKLMRMREQRVFNHTAEYFSLKQNQWLPIAGIIDDMEEVQSNEEKIQQMRETGFTKVKFIRSGNRGDCPFCREIAKKVYPIDAVPQVPPVGCTCNPWCRLCIVVKS